MFKNKKLIIIFAILIICITTFIYFMFSNNIMKLTSDEKKEVIHIVNTYYDGISTMNYSDAIELIHLDKSDFNKNLNIFKNSNYRISKPEGTNYWVTPVNGQYDYISINKPEKSFVVEVTLSTTYDDNTYLFNEYVYIKKFDNRFKIYKIYSSDRNYPLKLTYINN